MDGGAFTNGSLDSFEQVGSALESMFDQTVLIGIGGPRFDEAIECGFN